MPRGYLPSPPEHDPIDRMAQRAMRGVGIIGGIAAVAGLAFYGLRDSSDGQDLERSSATTAPVELTTPTESDSIPPTTADTTTTTIATTITTALQPPLPDLPFNEYLDRLGCPNGRNSVEFDVPSGYRGLLLTIKFTPVTNSVVSADFTITNEDGITFGGIGNVRAGTSRSQQVIIPAGTVTATVAADDIKAGHDGCLAIGGAELSVVFQQ